MNVVEITLDQRVAQARGEAASEVAERIGGLDIKQLNKVIRKVLNYPASPGISCNDIVAAIYVGLHAKIETVGAPDIKVQWPNLQASVRRTVEDIAKFNHINIGLCVEMVRRVIAYRIKAIADPVLFYYQDFYPWFKQVFDEIGGFSGGEEDSVLAKDKNSVVSTIFSQLDVVVERAKYDLSGLAFYGDIDMLREKMMDHVHEELSERLERNYAHIAQYAYQVADATVSTLISSLRVIASDDFKFDEAPKRAINVVVCSMMENLGSIDPRTYNGIRTLIVDGVADFSKFNGDVKPAPEDGGK